MALPRLTQESLRKAEIDGKNAGWHKLLMRGYLPQEIALYADPVTLPSDVITRVRDHARRHGLPVPSTCAWKRERGAAAPPSDWRAAFRTNVMRTGLCLHLTQPMLEFLCAVADGVIWDRSLICGSSLARPCNNIATGGSLEKRGLIRRRSEFTPKRDDDGDRESYYELTEAGEAVVQLLKSVGVFIEADAAIRKKAKVKA